jgi:hypothetical protein
MGTIKTAAHWRKAMKAIRLLCPVVIAVLALAPMGCTPDFVENSEADVILRLVRLTGDPGSSDQDQGDVLFSDVCCAIINDNITVEVELILKNPNVVLPGLFNDVNLERYELKYLRSDGRNVEGVDVPYRITGPLSSAIVITGTRTTVTVVGVRHQAKLEPPLKNLEGVFLGDTGRFVFAGAGILSTTGELTLLGRTTSGKVVRAVGRIQIVFADFSGEG